MAATLYQGVKMPSNHSRGHLALVCGSALVDVSILLECIGNSHIPVGVRIF